MKDIYLLNHYIRDISKNQLLTAEEEIDLSRRIQEEGDQAALQKLIRSNLRLVVKISIELCRSSVSVMDVIQNGNMGLLKAAEKFDYRKGVRFSTYAAFWIRQSILRGFIKPSRNVNISFRKDELNKKIKNFLKEYYDLHEVFPTLDEIVAELKVKRKDALDVLIWIRNSGESFLISESVEDIIDSVHDNRYNPETVLENKMMIEEVAKIIENFTDRESEIVRSRFGFDEEKKQTLHEIGSRFSITAEATRQIERKILNHIRDEHPDLASYLQAAS
jgi:RNA polymerase primary sigma factor